MKSHTLVLLHLAVFLAGWTGIFGRLISLIIASVAIQTLRVRNRA